MNQPILTFAYFSKGLVQPSTSWLRNQGGKGRWWLEKKRVGVFEGYGTFFLFGEGGRIDSKNILTKVLTQFMFYIFFGFLLYQCYVIKKQSVHIQKNAYTTYIEEFYNARSQRFLHGPCLKMVWCLSVLWEDETDETDQHHPTIFARMIGGWICSYSWNCCFFFISWMMLSWMMLLDYEVLPFDM